jgi:hypothetical protein
MKKIKMPAGGRGLAWSDDQGPSQEPILGVRIEVD